MPEDPAPPVDTAMDQRRPSTPGEDHPEPPPFTLEGKRVFVAHVDSRVGGVLGRAFRDAGCDVRGVRDGEKEVEFAKETYMADYDRHDGMRRAALAAADIVLIPLAVAPDTEAAKDTIETVEAAAADDGKKRVIIGVSSASSWAGGTSPRGNGEETAAADLERRVPVRGPGKLVADAERLVARAHKPGRLECFCVLPGMLYGEGEFDDGFLGLCRGAWEGEAVPVFGDGLNVLPLCHAGNVAAVALELAAEALDQNPGFRVPAVPDAIDPTATGTLKLNPKPAIPAYPSAVDSLQSRYVLAVDEDTPGATQISVAASIAREFAVPLVRFPASSLALSERLTPNLLTHAEFCSSDIARRAIVANATRHRGGWGAPVEVDDPSLADVLDVEDEKKEEEKATGADDGDGGGDAAPAEGEDDGSPWEPAPPKVGGAPAVIDAFLERNNLVPLRLVVRGPPLSFPEQIAEQIAEAYSVASLTPASLVRHWLPKCDQEVKDKCGYVEPEPEPEPEVEAAADGEDAAEKPKEKTEAELAAESAAKKKEAEETYAGYAEDVKLDLIRCVMALPEVKRSGYALSGLDVPPVGGATGPEETCAKLFTWIPPRPAMRLKPKPKPEGGEGADEGADGGANGGADAAPAEDEEPPPELPEETAEEAEARRCADPSSAPSDVILLKIADGGQHARSLKEKHPEEYEAYVEWARAEEEAAKTADGAKRSHADALKEWRKANKGKREGDEGYEPPPAEPSPACTDVLVAHLVYTWTKESVKSVTLHEVDARGTAHARTRRAKKSLGEPRNFRGMVGLSVDAPDPAEAEAARLEAEADAADVERRRARRERSEALRARQEKESEARELDALHARSASLRAYLASEVMPVVTDAMLQMLRIRPEDPALALSDYLLRYDRRVAIEEEAERAAKAAMERAVLEEEKKQEKERRLEISRRKAAEARAAIKPKSVVRFVPKVPPPRPRPQPAEEAA